MNTQSAQTSGRILIVDDNPKNLQVLGSTLLSENFVVEFSTSGKGALDRLVTENFDLILLDIMMPGMDGYETCKKIRNDLKNKEVPIIFLTAKTDTESILKGFESGAQDYITKPFDNGELMARVNTHIELTQARNKLKEFNIQLEKKVEERTHLLNSAYKELDVLDGVKAEFLNLISHEIRTPLNGIKGSLQLLKLRIENEELIQLINILDSSVIRLENFSYTAILITRLKSKKYNMVSSKFNLKDILDICLIPLNDEIQSKSLTIKNLALANEIIMENDNDLIYELIKRILDNAVKYSPEHSSINIDVERLDGHVILSVKDEGNGFPNSILNKELKLFNPGETHVNKNIGLNLYLSNLISEYLGGNMKIGNSSGGGAFVKMKIPLSNIHIPQATPVQI